MFESEQGKKATKEMIYSIKYTGKKDSFFLENV